MRIIFESLAVIAIRQKVQHFLVLSALTVGGNTSNQNFNLRMIVGGDRISRCGKKAVDRFSDGTFPYLKTLATHDLGSSTCLETEQTLNQ